MLNNVESLDGEYKLIEKPYKSNRGEAYNRYQRMAHINRKKRIIHSQHDYWWVDHDGMLSKGKIHCSCPLCRHKSYDYPKIQDIRNNEKLNESLEDYFFEENIENLIDNDSETC